MTHFIAASMHALTPHLAQRTTYWCHMHVFYPLIELLVLRALFICIICLFVSLRRSGVGSTSAFIYFYYIYLHENSSCTFLVCMSYYY